MKLSRSIKAEVAALARSESLKNDMQIMAERKCAPFIKDGRTDVDAFIAFIIEFNEFINHEPRPFSKMPDRDMVL